MGIFTKARELYENKIKPTIGLSSKRSQGSWGSNTTQKSRVKDIASKLLTKATTNYTNNIAAERKYKQEFMNKPYVKNRYVESVKNIPANAKQLLSKKSTGMERLTGGLGLLGGVATLFPDPIGDIAIPMYDFAKGYGYSKRRGGTMKERLKAGKESLTLEKPIGLGEALTTNKTAGSIGNLAELPAMLLAGGVVSKSSTKSLIKELDYLSNLKATGKLTEKQLKRFNAIEGLLNKTKSTPNVTKKDRELAEIARKEKVLYLKDKLTAKDIRTRDNLVEQERRIRFRNEPSTIKGEGEALVNRNSITPKQPELGVTPFEYTYKQGYSAEATPKTVEKIGQKKLNAEIGEAKAMTPKEKKYTIADITKNIKEATNKGIDVPVAKPYEPKIVKGMLDRNVLAVKDFFNKQGTPGKVFTKMYESARYEGDTMAGRATVELENVLKKLSKEDIKNFADVAEGRLAPATKELKRAVETWNRISQDVAKKASETGLMIKTSDGQTVPFAPKENYFPHFVPEEIVNNAKTRKDALVKMVQSGWATNLAQAEAKFNRYVLSKIKRRYGNLEKAREIDFPIYEKDPTKVLLSYVDSAYHRLGEAKYFGPGDERAYRLASRISENGGDGRLATDMLNRIFGKEDFSPYAKKISSTLTGLQTVTKLGVGAVTNTGQSISTSAYTSLPRMIQAMAYSIGGNKEEAKQFTKLTGEILNSSVKEFAESFGAGEKLPSKFLKLVKFTASEEFNRTVAANAGRFEMKSLAERLLNNPTDASLIRRIEKFGVDPNKIIRRGKVGEEDLIRAGNNVVENTQFKTQPFDLPYSWSSPVGKVLTQFKSFSYKQTKFMGNLAKEIGSEASKGNLKPLINALATFGIAAPIAGEVLGDIKSVLKNKSRKEEKPLERYLNDLFFTASLGLLEDVGTLATGKYGASGNIGVVGGPTASDAYKLLEAGQSLFRDRKTMMGMDEVKARVTPLARLATKQIPVVGPAIESALIPNTYSRSFVGANTKAKTSSAQIIEDLKKYPPETQNKMMESLKKVDPAMYKKVYTKQMEETLKITKKEESIRSMGVENYDRARAVVNVLKKMDPSERPAYISRLKKLGVLTDTVYKQLLEAIKLGALQ